MTKRCLRCRISGKVQGVWYRASTQNQALKLGITGWVCNSPNGEVEAFICGEEAALSAMQKWLGVGPLLARVDHVEVVEVDYQEHLEFRVRD